MKTKYNALAKIDVELFYAVTIYEYNLCLQGKQSSETIKYLKHAFNISDWEVGADGFMRASFEIDGIKVEVALT